MKFIMYRVDRRSNKKQPRQRLDIERILFLSCLGVFILLILVQAALTSPALRTFLNAEAAFEGTPLGIEEYLYKEGELGLRLLSDMADQNCKVLVNGEVIAEFSEVELMVNIKDGDVIEIDASGAIDSKEVEVVSKSDNIKTECLNKKYLIDGNIKKLFKVRVE